MSRNKLGNLNDILMETLQNIVDPDVDKNGKIINEITPEKARSVASISQAIISNAKVQLDAYKLVSEGRVRAQELPEVFRGDNIKQLGLEK